jgi:ribose transport system substrate-binding protein
LIGSGGTDLSVGAIFALCNFTGADWYEVGRLLAEDVVKQCGAGSGRARSRSCRGELTAAASVDQIGGIT